MGVRLLRALCSSARTYTTGSWTTPYTLATKTPLIRPLAGSSTDHSHEAIQRDFMFWPTFYTAEEGEEILKMALWKLDRADSTRRRRRKSQTDQMQQDSRQDSGLQKLFHGEYGFEEVSSCSKGSTQDWRARAKR
jgi:alkylated DNA repair protein alkB family protein 7